MSRILTYLSIFIFSIGLCFSAQAEYSLAENLAEESNFIQKIHKLQLLVERESYEFTKSLCYIFKFRHKYGNEEFPSNLIFHIPRLLQKFPSDEKLRDSIARWLFLVAKDVVAIFSDTGQAEYGVLYRAAYSKFLLGTSGFMKAATECGEEMGKENFPEEIVAHIHTNSMLSSALSLAGIFGALRVTVVKIANTSVMKGFFSKLSASTKKTMIWSLIGAEIAIDLSFGYIVFTELHEQQEDIEKTRKMLDRELPILDGEEIAESNKNYIKTMLSFFYRDYIYSETNPSDSSWKAICLKRRKIYREVFSKYEDILQVLQMEIPLPGRDMESIYETMKSGEKLLEEEGLKLHQAKLYSAIRLILDGDSLMNNNGLGYPRQENELFSCGK